MRLAPGQVLAEAGTRTGAVCVAGCAQTEIISYINIIVLHNHKCNGRLMCVLYVVVFDKEFFTIVWATWGEPSFQQLSLLQN